MFRIRQVSGSVRSWLLGVVVVDLGPRVLVVEGVAGVTEPGPAPGLYLGVLSVSRPW